MRTRFPPSPTGLLHVGGLRTALYNELIAKQTQGQFLLRIEDTDQEREVPGATENILSSLAWAGIVPDEGMILSDGVATQKGPRGPYLQSERLPMYQEHVKKLLGSGHAYHCFCTKQRLDEMRTRQQERGQAPMYNRHCTHLTPEEVLTRIAAGEPHVIRMKVPHERTITFDDAIRGNVTFQGHTIDDQVLLKSDGFPTYHLANVVDDHLMEIELVLRGEEWLSSTPKHILLFEAFNWPAPRYGHVPLLLNADKTKLSKRQNSVSVQEYIDRGYLPEAMINFLALLGWNPGTEQEIFSKDELIAAFSLDRVQKAGAVFDLTKLDWLQGQWMRKMPATEFVDRIRPLVAERFPQAAKDVHFATKAALIQDRITFLHESPDMLAFFYEPPAVTVELLANPKQKVSREDLPSLFEIIRTTLDSVSSWDNQALLAAFKAATATHSKKLGQLLWPLRVALTGREYSPGAVEVAEVLGKEEAMRRLDSARKAIV